MLAAALIAVFPAVSMAQTTRVGHSPDNSPYEDFKIGQTLSVLAGRLSVGADPAGVAPKSSAMGSVRYDIGVGGPASLFVRYLFASSERVVLQPSNPAPTRRAGEVSTTTHLLDMGFDISLTGRKTWHHLMPSINTGIGLAGDFASTDVGGYRFGTRFAFTYGGSLRILPPQFPQLRVDVTNALWKFQYPDRYFVKAADSTSVLTLVRHKSGWRGNWAMSAGVSIPVFR